MKLLGSIVVNAASLLITAYLIPGFIIQDLKTALIAAVVIGIINTFIKPVLKIITLPITFITLGLFALVLNVFLLWGAAYITPGFTLEGLLPAILGSIVLSLVSSFLGLLTH